MKTDLRKTEDRPGIWVLDALRRGGVDVEQLSARMPGLVRSVLQDPSGLTPDEVNILLLECEALSGDASFGLHMIDFVEMSMYGTYGYLLLNAPTVGGLLEMAERYYPLFYRGAKLIFSVRETVARCEYVVDEPVTVSRRHDNEWTLGFFVDFIRARVAQPWDPHRVTFTNEPPDDLSELHRVLGRNLSFNEPAAAFEFDRVLLEQTINDADPRLLRILTDEAEALLPGLNEAKPFATEVRLQILERLEAREANADAIAQRMAMSLSTFKRRLAQDNLNYRALREDVIRDVASKALVETDLSVSLIAYKVGYSELSAFDRAFGRITGMAPSVFRLAHQR